MQGAQCQNQQENERANRSSPNLNPVEHHLYMDTMDGSHRPLLCFVNLSCAQSLETLSPVQPPATAITPNRRKA